MIFSIIVLLTISNLVGSNKLDPNGYITYCPCMGRFGNQMEQFLEALSFAKHVGRTLIVPPLVEYGSGREPVVMVDYDTYFQIKSLEEFHRVITMRDFMENLADTVWPKEKRFAFCWNSRKSIFDESAPAGCHAKDGTPFGPFWDNFNIDFVKDVYFGDIIGENHFSSYNAIRKWKLKFPVKNFPVLAFITAPGDFPINPGNKYVQKFIRWSSKIVTQAKKFIEQNLPRPFVGIHLRNNVDWIRVCEHITPSMSRPLFSSEQCTGPYNAYGELTSDVCFPSKETILKDIEKVVKENNIKSLFVSSDKDHMIEEINNHLKVFNVKAYKLEDNNPHVSLAILQASNHFIGNCVSTFTAFVTRAREFSQAKASRPTTFFGFKPRTKKRKIEL
ncbi:GDP-fucose protein O-fucosyltransferase 1 [Strongyloides ratti]|uniref:GDP-fucose protein O-fucosyltransferase 1 n=1 Tax=Strongyloides ratti TaxID=34506 RepID=A0A090LRQ0_STRRB|nr:GDP-fucose protein O-fucosyltransferase 1 [Strongyloides ratti]CEF70241.1 GDP-fucose protein O-fucosyltransferase 1 [Strongyloides ratti]